MAEEPEPEITSKNNTIDEDDLDLSLGLRPLNPPLSSSSARHLPKKLPKSTETATINGFFPSNGHTLSKRDAQALRRHEAKVKRDLKRKGASFYSPNGVVILEQEKEKADEDEDDFPERRRKVHAFGFQPSFLARPPSLGNAGGFRPYQGQNGKFANDGENRSSLSSGSSSGVSDNYHSNSGQGGNSSDAGSHSSHHSPQFRPSNFSTASTSQIQPCSSQLEIQPNGSYANCSQPQFCSSFYNQRELFTSSRQSSKSPEGASSSNGIMGSSSDKELTPTPRSTSPKEADGVMGKPPKPAGQMSQQGAKLSEMPCVSTTGNGPEGKTITGFLYKYTKTEVNIVCVCHGATFSPAGFVEHAGGVDIEHPLRHIRVVPFSLG